LVNIDKSFFSDGFSYVPYELLFPNESDEFYRVLKDLRDKYSKTTKESTVK